MEAREVLGWNLRRLRVERGLSQRRLAVAAEIDHAYLGRVERAKVNVTLNFIEATARALDVPVAELFVVPQAGTVKPERLPAGRPRSSVNS